MAQKIWGRGGGDKTKVRSDGLSKFCFKKPRGLSSGCLWPAFPLAGQEGKKGGAAADRCRQW